PPDGGGGPAGPARTYFRRLPPDPEGLLEGRRRAVAGVDVDAARLHDEAAAAVLDPEVAPVARDRHGPPLARSQRHALEPTEPAHRLGDARDRVVDVQLHDLI